MDCIDFKTNYENFKKCLKRYPYLKFLEDVACCDMGTLKKYEGRFYSWILNQKDSESETMLAVVGHYSKISYCKYQYGYWPSVCDFTYLDSVASDMGDLFTILHPTIRERLEYDYKRLKRYVKTKDPVLRKNNCFLISHP